MPQSCMPSVQPWLAATWECLISQCSHEWHLCTHGLLQKAAESSTFDGRSNQYGYQQQHIGLMPNECRQLRVHP